jgi:hypothetical protein
MARTVSLAGALLLACTAPATTTSPGTTTSNGLELFWASYQMNAEPHYRLIFEGGTDAVRPTEVRIVLPSGATAASATAVSVPNDNDPLLLCGPTKTSAPRLYGPVRATVAVSDQLFKDFIRQGTGFRVEARIADAWRPTRLTHLCDASQ